MVDKCIPDIVRMDGSYLQQHNQGEGSNTEGRIQDRPAVYKGAQSRENAGRTVEGCVGHIGREIVGHTARENFGHTARQNVDHTV